jgi:hypothetical protein
MVLMVCFLRKEWSTERIGTSFPPMSTTTSANSEAVDGAEM